MISDIYSIAQQSVSCELWAVSCIGYPHHYIIYMYSTVLVYIWLLCASAESQLRVVSMDLALSLVTQLLAAEPQPQPLDQASRATPTPSREAAVAQSRLSSSSSSTPAPMMQRLRELATAELQSVYLLLAHQLKRLMPKEAKVCFASHRTITHHARTEPQLLTFDYEYDNDNDCSSCLPLAI